VRAVAIDCSNVRRAALPAERRDLVPPGPCTCKPCHPVAEQTVVDEAARYAPRPPRRRTRVIGLDSLVDRFVQDPRRGWRMEEEEVEIEVDLRVDDRASAPLADFARALARASRLAALERRVRRRLRTKVAVGLGSYAAGAGVAYLAGGLVAAVGFAAAVPFAGGIAFAFLIYDAACDLEDEAGS
jgi:hypothetical protein